MLISWKEVYILRNIKENTEAFIVASKTGQVNVDNSKYMVIFKDQNAGQSHNMKADPLRGERNSNIWEQP
jgi:hypothetical protein